MFLVCPKRDNFLWNKEEVYMSQKAVELLIGRLITVDQFRQMASTSLSDACFKNGLELTSMEIDLLSRMEIKSFAELSCCIDPGLRRAGRSVGN